MGVITFTSCFIQNFTNASYFSGMFLGFKVRRKKKQINEISLMSLYLKIHPTGYRRPVLCWSMIPPAPIVVLITGCSPFQGSKQTYYRKRAKLLRQGWNGRYFLWWGFSLRKGTEGSTSSKRYLVRNGTEKWFWYFRLKVLLFLCSLDTTAEVQVQGCKAQY